MEDVQHPQCFTDTLGIIESGREGDMGETTNSAGNIERVGRLSPSQEGILYHSLLADDPSMYVQQYTCRLKGPLNVDLFQAAWDQSVAEYAALRTLVAWRGRESPLQVVREVVQLDWHLEDLTAADPDTQSRVLSERSDSDRERGFDLEQAPLMRLALFKLDELTHRFVWTQHHIILDGWSTNLVLERVFSIYADLVHEREPVALTEVSYDRFVQAMAKKDRTESGAFWEAYLKGFDEPNSLTVADQAPSSPHASTQHEASLQLSTAETEALDSTSRRLGVTLDTLLKAAWAIVMSRYTDSQDVVMGSAVSGRPPDLAGSLEMVGLMINTIPVRIDVSPEMRCSDLVRALEDGRLELAEHDWMPLAEIQDRTAIPRGRPLFDSILVLENLRPLRLPDDVGLEVEDARYPQRSNIPVALLANPADSLEFVLLHDPERFEESEAAALLNHLKTAIAAITSDADHLIRDVQLLNQDELNAVSRPSVDHPPIPTVVEEIRLQAQATPDAIAIAQGDYELSYSSLLSRAEALAGVLVQLGASPTSPVAISLPRSPAQIVAIVGALLASAAYVPLDDSIPKARFDRVLSDVEAGTVITSNCAETPAGLEHVCLDPEGVLIHPTEVETVSALEDPVPEDTAYVIFTSGSTGTPKGVPITHRSLALSTKARLDYYEAPVESYLLVSPIHFDSSVAGIFWTLCSGGELVLPEEGAEQDIWRLSSTIVSRQITHTLMLPSVLRLLAESSPEGSLNSLRVAIAAGEPLPSAVVMAHRSSGFQWKLYNEYGPTEATVWSTVLDTDELERPPPDRIPIGYPIGVVGHHILDRNLLPAPPGVVGELYLSGETLTEGYIGDTIANEQSFVRVFTASDQEERLYRTGDLARVDSKGRFDIVGRADRQVKIRGIRVEPGEVEATLQSHPEIQDAVVVPSGSNSEARIDAFVTTASPIATAEVEGFLEQQLPGHLVPSSVTVLTDFPRTASGKVDIGALGESREHGDVRASPDESKWTPSERLVVELARELIDDRTIDTKDNFFDAGGHSLLSMQLIARIYRETGQRVSPNTVLFNSLSYVASQLDGSEVTPTSSRPETSVEAAFIEGPKGPLFTVLHPGRKSAPPTLLVPPYGWEYYKTHSALRRLAASLAETGGSVLRFDLYGVGDSGGGPADTGIAQWLDDVEQAAQHLMGLSGASAVNVVGIRLGASLSALWAADNPKAERVVMWDPVISGAEHLAQLRTMHNEFMSTKGRSNSRHNDPSQLLGTEYPQSLRQSLATLNLSEIDSESLDATVLLSSEDLIAADRLRSHGMRVEVVPDAGGWNDQRTFNWALLPSAIPRRIVGLIGGDDG